MNHELEYAVRLMDPGGSSSYNTIPSLEKAYNAIGMEQFLHMEKWVLSLYK